MTFPKNTTKLDDLEAKIQNAKAAAEAPHATERKIADYKLLQQELVGERLRTSQAKVAPHSASKADTKLDEALKDSFPGSDPISFVEAAPAHKDSWKKPH